MKNNSISQPAEKARQTAALPFIKLLLQLQLIERKAAIRPISSVLLIAMVFIISFDVHAQSKASKIVISGEQVAKPLLEAWSREYTKNHPATNIVISTKAGSSEKIPDITIDLGSSDKGADLAVEHFNIGSYAILPVANSQSEFARVFGKKGLDAALIKQVFFDDIFADEKEKAKITQPYSVYSRLGNEGTPEVFAKHYGYGHENITGKVIAGSDVHLIKAILKDPSAVSFNPISLLYDESGKPVDGLTVLPVDLNGNGKISDEEKIFDDLDQVVQYFESEPGNVKNIPTGELQISIHKNNTNPEAVRFLRWVLTDGQKFLAQYGYFRATDKELQSAIQKIEQLALNR